jgi:hypothetical protein
MKKAFILLVASWISITSFSQGTSTTATLITPGDFLPTSAGASQSVFTNYCLVAGSAQTSTTCATNLTDVRWFKFTVPAGTPSAAVKITVVPTGFDAVIDFYAGTAASPIFKECSNAAVGNTTEILRTTWATNPVNPGTEYYFRVSSTTDVASGCFDAKVEYFPTAFVNASPNPAADTGLPGYKANQFLKRNYPAAATPNALVQSTRFRVVNIADGTVTCTGTIAGAADQLLIYNIPCMCYGNNYNVWVELKLDGIWCGEGPVRQVNMESTPTNSISNAACASQTLLSGVLNTTYFGTAAQIEWEFSSGGTVVATVQTPVGATNIQLYNPGLSCLRYNRIYSVRVRMKYCNVWGDWSSPYCLITAPIPYLTITGPPASGYANICGTTISQYSFVYTQFVQGASQYIWQVAQVNPSAPTIPIAPAVVTTTGIEYLNLATQGLTPGLSYRIAAKPRLTSCNSPQEGDYGQFCLITVAGGVAPENPSSLQAQDGNEHVDVNYRNSELPMEVDQQGNVAVISFQGIDQKLITVRFLSELALGKGRVDVLNVAGQLIYSTEVFSESLDQLIQLPLPQNCSTGLYLVKFQTERGSVTEKFYLN